MNKISAKKSPVIVVLGPTSSGKSAAAILLAKKFDGEVISADSRQIYKDMNLGTGKVEGEWKFIDKNHRKKAFYSEGIAHHLLDFRSPRGEYNIAHFKRDCEKKLQEIVSRKKLPIICGGTGFWIDAVVSGTVLPQVKPNPALRKKLAMVSTASLLKKLEKLDGARSKNIDQKNRPRLIRAIEIASKLGKVPELKSQESTEFKFLQLGIDWPQEKLDHKINKRLNGRWQAGMIAEIETLKEKYRLSWQKIQSFGLGYYWIPLFIQGKIDKTELRKRVFLAERGYAKRQRTWFYRNKKIIWENHQRQIESLVSNFLK